MDYCYKYPHPAVTTDCVIFGYDGGELKVLLIQRGQEPYRHYWALPGGFVRMDESTEQGATRELREETGLTGVNPVQFHTYSAVDRDPRERVITVAHYALVNVSAVRGGDDAADARWYKVTDLPPLAFDHARILQDALTRLREDIFFRPVAFELLPDVFTMSELQKLYERILGVTFDRRNFHKKVLSLGILEPLARPAGTPTRYATQYRFLPKRYAAMKASGFRFEF